MKTILVTGGAGYVGSHACKALAQAGYLPVTYDNLVYGHEWAVRWGPLERGDLLDAKRLVEVIERHRPGAVMHFAAYAYVGESVQDPAKYYRNNVQGTQVLLDAMRAAGLDRLVFSSSCATYGIPDTATIHESHRQAPVSPYGRTKLIVEQMLQDYAAAYGLRSASLRYFNAAGADPDGEIGEMHVPETHLIPLVLQAAADESQPVAVFGTDYPTPDGTCVRDFIHVTDLADAHVRALDLLRGAGARACNLGTGRGHSVREVIAAAERVTGRGVAQRQGPRRPGDPPCLVADAAAAAVTLGWRPRHSSLQNILDTAWRWMTQRLPAVAGTSGR